MGPTAILFNPSSGRGKSQKKRQKIESALKKQRINYRWFTSKSEKHLKKLAKSAAKEFPVVVAVGGDTTFQIVASELLSAKTSAAMGMLGTGSTNDISRCLGLSCAKTLGKAINSRKTRHMDVGILEIPGKSPTLFLGVLSLGLGVAVNRYMSGFWSRHPILKRGGDLMQNFAGIQGIRNSFRGGAVPSKIRMRTEDIDEWLDYALMTFSNINYYAGGLMLTPDITPFDGQLGCCIIQTQNWRQTVAIGLQSRKKKHINNPHVRILAGSSFELSSEIPIDVQYDGEVIPSTSEFRISIEPASLKIIG